jgi:hypothetical protein
LVGLGGAGHVGPAPATPGPANFYPGGGVGTPHPPPPPGPMRAMI